MDKHQSTWGLKFRDFNKIDTIDKHKEIINNYKMVYWGFWKKPYENLLSSQNKQTWFYTNNQQIIAELPFPKEIWLCNIKAKRVYCAYCTGIVSKNDINTEERKKIPYYYRSKSNIEFYFVFSKITQIDYDEFYSENRKIIDFSTNDTCLIPHKRIDEDSNIIEISSNKILHISDLHFGTKCMYKEGAIHKRGNTDRLMSVFDHIEKIGLIIASGDFVYGADSKNDNNAYNKSFINAKTFLIDLCKKYNLDPKKHLLIVPGNHDKGYVENDSSSDLDIKIKNDYEEKYRSFQNELIGHSKFTYVKKYRYNSNNIIMVCLDSSELQSEKIREYGYVDINKLSILDDIKLGDSIKIAIMHYPLVNPPAKMTIKSYKDSHGVFHAEPISILENAFDVAKELTNKKFQFVFHGHQHYPYSGKYKVYNSQKKMDAEINFISAGSVAHNNVDNMYPDFPNNSFNIYTIENNSIDVVVYSYKIGSSPVVLSSYTISFSYGDS